MKLCAHVRNYVPGYEVLSKGVKLRVWVQITYEFLCQGVKFCAPGIKLRAQVQTFIHGHEALCPHMKLCARV
jgi:hypothetical protein